jgi:hypothetical protein
MSDICIYYFMSNEVNGENRTSARPATLEAIKGRGRPLMESQIVVDHTELDRDGFLADGGESHGIIDIDAQIWSLGVGAASRDSEAIDSTDDIVKNMRGLESRERRKQTRPLRSQRIEHAASESSNQTDARDFIHFGAGLATE